MSYSMQTTNSGLHAPFRRKELLVGAGVPLQIEMGHRLMVRRK